MGTSYSRVYLYPLTQTVHTYYIMAVCVYKTINNWAVEATLCFATAGCGGEGGGETEGGRWWVGGGRHVQLFLQGPPRELCWAPENCSKSSLPSHHGNTGGSITITQLLISPVKYMSTFASSSQSSSRLMYFFQGTWTPHPLYFALLTFYFVHTIYNLLAFRAGKGRKDLLQSIGIAQSWPVCSKLQPRQHQRPPPGCNVRLHDSSEGDPGSWFLPAPEQAWQPSSHHQWCVQAVTQTSHCCSSSHTLYNSQTTLSGYGARVCVLMTCMMQKQIAVSFSKGVQ